MNATGAYVIGVDYGSDSVRTIIADASNGKEIASSVFYYPRWKDQLYCDAGENQFRQHPLDYVEGLEETIKRCLIQAGSTVAANIKGYKTSDGKPLYLFNGESNQLNVVLPINNGAVATSDLYFTPVETTAPNGGKALEFSADLGDGKTVYITYTLPADEYMMSCNMRG